MGRMEVLCIYFQRKFWTEAREQQLVLVQSYLLKHEEWLLMINKTSTLKSFLC